MKTKRKTKTKRAKQITVRFVPKGVITAVAVAAVESGKPETTTYSLPDHPFKALYKK